MFVRWLPEVRICTCFSTKKEKKCYCLGSFKEMKSTFSENVLCMVKVHMNHSLIGLENLAAFSFGEGN